MNEENLVQKCSGTTQISRFSYPNGVFYFESSRNYDCSRNIIINIRSSSIVITMVLVLVLVLL